MGSPQRRPLRPLQNVERFSTGSPDQPIRKQPVDVLNDLQEVMDALNMLDENLAGIPGNCLSISINGGALSLSNIKSGELDDSWLSHQTLSNSSFLGSNLTASSGTLFNSFSMMSSESGMLEWSLPPQENLSIISEGNFGDRVSEAPIDFAY